MNVFLFRGSKTPLSESEAAALRQVCAHDDDELQRRAAADEPIVEIIMFTGEWPAAEARVQALFDAIATGRLPLVVSEHASDEEGGAYEKSLTLDQARARLQFFGTLALLRDALAPPDSGASFDAPAAMSACAVGER